MPMADPPQSDDERLLFNEPWEAAALALSIAPKKSGHFTSAEWLETLDAEINAAQNRTDPDEDPAYFLHALSALERLVSRKVLASQEIPLDRRQKWEDAFRNTPHGQPVVLPKDVDQAPSERCPHEVVWGRRANGESSRFRKLFADGVGGRTRIRILISGFRFGAGAWAAGPARNEPGLARPISSTVEFAVLASPEPATSGCLLSRSSFRILPQEISTMGGN